MSCIERGKIVYDSGWTVVPTRESIDASHLRRKIGAIGGELAGGAAYFRVSG